MKSTSVGKSNSCFSFDNSDKSEKPRETFHSTETFALNLDVNGTEFSG